MSKDKTRKSNKKKAGKKESQLAIRVEKSERDAFVELCETLDTSAAREIRRFMRDFVAGHRAQAEAAAPVVQKDEGQSPVVDQVDVPVTQETPEPSTRKRAEKRRPAAKPAPVKATRATRSRKAAAAPAPTGRNSRAPTKETPA